MASLSAHLCRPDDHGRLGFHPGCPQCRSERLAGSLRTPPFVGRPAQAAFTAGVLAVTSFAPSAAFAADAGNVVEGAAPEMETADFDPGGDSGDQYEDA